MSLLDFFAQAPQAWGRYKKGLDDAAERQRRTKAKQEALIEPFPETLRPTPEERAINQADIARQLNEQAAREEIARDNALIDAGFPPFAVRPGFNLSDPDGRYTDPNTVMPPPASAAPPAPAAKPAPNAVEAAPATPKGPTNAELRAAPLDEEGKRFAGLLDSMGQADMRGRDQRINGISVQGENESVAAQDPGFLSRLGRGMLDYYSDPVNRKTLAIGLAGLSSQPNRGYQAALQGQVEQIQEQRALQRSGNATAKYLEDQGLFAEAEIVRANPSLASDILGGVTAAGGSSYQKELEKIIAQDDRDLVNNAFAAEENYERTKQTLSKLDDPMFLGRFSEAKTELAKVLQGLGVDASDQNAFGEWLQKGDNTLRMRAVLGQQVFQAIGELGIGARGLDTPAERQFLIEVMAGQPGQTKGFLQALLKDRMSKQETIVKRYNTALSEGRLDRFSRLARRPLSPIDIGFVDDDDFSNFSIVN